MAAILAQVLNNWLTYQRENKKYLKEVYGNFISKFFADIISYAVLNSTPARGLESKGEVKISAVIEEMFKVVHYGNEHIQALHLEYNNWRYMEDNKGDSETILQMKICYHFLLYSKEIFKKIDFPLETATYHRLDYSIKVYGYLYVCAEVKGFEEALNNLTSIGMFQMDIINNLSLKEINEVVTCKNFEVQEKFIKTKIHKLNKI